MKKRKSIAMVFALASVIVQTFPAQAGNRGDEVKKVGTIIVDDFEKGTIWNNLENRSGAFQKEPSYCIPELGENMPGVRDAATAGHFLILNYGKCTKGGPGDEGGWCGWYTLLKTGDSCYLDLTGYNFIRFCYRPVNGNEDFIIGMADKKWDLIEDSVKLQNPTKTYVTERFTSGWLEVTVPLADFEGLELDKMSSLAIVFEAGKGTVYMDNIAIGSDPKYESLSYSPGTGEGKGRK